MPAFHSPARTVPPSVPPVPFPLHEDPSTMDLSRLDWSALPPRLRDLQDLLGPVACLLLLEAHGGEALYIPSRPGADHPLAAAIGLPALERLARHHGGEKLQLPKLDAIQRQLRLQELRALRQDGMSVAGLARRFNLTPRRVRQILAA